MNKKINSFIVAAITIVSLVSFIYGSVPDVSAFGVRGAFLRDSNSFNVLFDAGVASSSVTVPRVLLSTSTVQSVFTSPDNPTGIFGMASGTLNVGNTVTVSSTVTDFASNSNGSTTPQTLLPGIKIAAVRAGKIGNNLDEYIMLYSAMGQSWSASSSLKLHVVKGGHEDLIPLTFFTSIVPANGFFLIGSGNGYSGSIALDAAYSSSSDVIATTTTAVYISSTSTPGIDIIDKVEWGATPQIISGVSFSFATSTANNNLPLDNVIERKSAGNSGANTMASGGGDSNKGNGYDTRDNGQDFVVLSGGQVAIIKNSHSSGEFAFGGGQVDTTPPTVMGSFPGGAPGEMIPTDLNFIGFGISKPINMGTITSSTVVLVEQGQGTNLCSLVLYSNAPTTNGPQGQCFIPSGTLVAGHTYIFTIKGASSSPNVTDNSGNALNQPGGQHGTATHDYQVTFSPASGFVLTPQVPPVVVSVLPAQGSSGIPTNTKGVAIRFNQAMDVTSFSGVSLMKNGGSNVLNGSGAILSSDGMTVSVPISALSLVVGSTYTLLVPTTVKNSKNIFLPTSYISTFVTGSGGDVTGPTVIGHLPNIATGVPMSAVDIHVTTDDVLDASTVTSSTVQITDASLNQIPGTLSYDPVAKEILFIASNVFQPNTTYLITLNASGTVPSVKNNVGLALQDTDGTSNGKYQFSFTTSGIVDVTQPGVLFATANTFSLAITFDQAMKQAEVENIANYALTSGGTPVSLSSFNGNTATYDSSHRTVKINNIALTAGATFVVTVSNVHDLSGNLIDGSKTSANGTVVASTANGGEIGMGGGYVAPTGGLPTGFSTGSFGFVPQVEVRPMNMVAGFNSNYSVNLPISTRIPASGKIVLSFPSSFALANAAADTFSPANNDINGPGSGTVTIASVVGNDTAHTVTVTLGGVATSLNGSDAHDFLHFDLAQIGNSPVPNTSSGYTVDLRTLNGATTLESFTSKPFFITSAGSNTLTVNVTAAGASGGAANVYLFSPQTGPISSSTTTFSGGAASVVFSLPTGMYGISTDPIIALTGGTYVGQSSPLPVNVSGTTSASITLSAGSGLASTTVSIHATASGKKVSVFAGGPNGYVDAPFTTINGTSTVTLYYPSNGDFTVGVGPQINKTFGGPPPAPDYVMPKPVQVHVASNVASQSVIGFDLVSAGQHINGFVQDASGKVVAGANVNAYSPQGGFGTFGTTASDGGFQLSVAAGSYNLGAFAPGFPSGQEISVTVSASDSLFVNGSVASSSSVIIKLSKPGTKITGKVTDGTNPIQGAQVWAYCDSSVNGNACFGPNSHAEAQADSSGAFTLYVGNGTWRVSAFIPGYGQQPEITEVVSGSDVTTPDFQPSATGSFNSVSGTVCTNTGSDCTSGSPTAISGASVMIEGTDSTGHFYSNSIVTGSDGTYSFSSNVPSGVGSSYRVRGFASGLGELPTSATFSVTGNIIGKDLVIKAGRAINISVVGAPAAFDAFLKFTNVTTGGSNFLNLHNNTLGTIQVPNGSVYAIDARSQGFNLPLSSLTLTGGTASYASSTGRLTLNGGSFDTVALNLTYPSSNALSGTVTDNTSALVANAWVDISDAANGFHFGTQTNASGTYAIAVGDGSYQIAANVPGYLSSSKSLSLSGGTVTFGSATTTANAVNLIVSKTSLTISGTITVGGVAASGALVKGSLLGGGTSVVVAGTDGTYSLPVANGIWTLSAASDGYENATYASGVVVSGSSILSININLTILKSLPAPTVQSITPSEGGTLRNNTGNLSINIPKNALGSSGSAGQIKATETTNFVDTATTNVLGGVQDIKAYDSSNHNITDLNDYVTLSFDIASSSFVAYGLTSTSTANKLKLGYWDASLGDWVSIATTITYFDPNGAQVTPNSTLSNVDHINLSASVKHFTVFGPILPTDSLAPSAPTGVLAALNGSSVRVTWTAPTTNSDSSSLTDFQEYEIYRDTSLGGNFTTQVNSSQVAGTSFTDTTVSGGTTYYYKVTAVDTSGNASLKSSASGGITTPSSGGASYYSAPTPVITVVTPTSTPVVVTTTSTQAVVSMVTTPTKITVITTPSSKSVVVLTLTLKLGSQNSQVKILQQLLAQDKDLYPEGLATGYFGPATKKAIERFQKKYGIATTPASLGLVGPLTRAKILEVLGAPR
ncbi:MAG: carboxypeptidase regulatory-like domain-containing protein [Parcubacteria group bacterium]|nr:carboxypeptidase regulatory-like domain-containing protein [Parcubacteria group bacterium]